MEEENIYVVQEGDNLFSISNKFNIDITTLRRINNLKNSNLTVGMKLKIKQDTTKSYEYYVVEQNDSLYTIASKFNTTVDSIKSLNNLTDDKLSIGDILIIKKASLVDDKKTECYGPAYTDGEEEIYEIYTVKKGDNLYKIADIYKVNINNLMNLNNLKDTNLSLNQELKIPIEEDTYKVQSKDNLYKIAEKFNTTIDALKSKNNLKSNQLYIGQNLKI